MKKRKKLIPKKKDDGQESGSESVHDDIPDSSDLRYAIKDVCERCERDHVVAHTPCTLCEFKGCPFFAVVTAMETFEAD